jgi:hypothetical protein
MSGALEAARQYRFDVQKVLNAFKRRLQSAVFG